MNVMKEVKVFCLIHKSYYCDAIWYLRHSYGVNVPDKCELLIFDLRERFVSTKSVAFTENSFPKGEM